MKYKYYEGSCGLKLQFKLVIVGFLIWIGGFLLGVMVCHEGWVRW